MAHTSSIQLRLEKIEDRSRRNNLRFRGIPEDIGEEALHMVVRNICQKLGISTAPREVEFDRMHRAPRPCSIDLARPRDVIGRLHRYAHKVLISRKAWEVGTLNYEGAVVKIFPDLSRATLQRRAQLRPLLEKIRLLGGSYRWGYPISLMYL